MSEKSYHREEWVRACGFSYKTNQEVLDKVLSAVKENTREKPVVIMDLDSTVIEVAHRTRKIMLESIGPLSTLLPPIVVEKVSTLHHKQMGFSVGDTLANIGISLSTPEMKAAHDLIKSYWWKKFFTNDYLSVDLPYEGSVKFCQDLHMAGAHITYLTARDAPGMKTGTEKSLVAHGFPFNLERTTLLMKPTVEMEDHEYKVSACREIRELGMVVASFENEPKNYCELKNNFPNALHVFVDTVCSERPALPCRGGYRITGFR